ncbi:MFS transporter [Anaerolineales bacterium HSG24]|nr:MFS transporter [Anaerolineales bacterium HSG24]
MTIFRHKVFLAIILGHFTIDLFTNMGSVVITYLSNETLLLTTAQIGLAISLYQLINGSIQPIFGLLADRIGTRWLGPLSIGWTIFFFALSVFVAKISQNFTLFLIVFVMAAFGSAAFHPMGTMHAATADKKQVATGTSIFFLFGQSGLALGPILAGLILKYTGVIGIYGLAISALPLLFFIGYTMRDTKPYIPKTSNKTSSEQWRRLFQEIQWPIIGILFLLIGLRSWAFLGTVSFLPKLFQNMGWESDQYGAITGIYWIASAIMGVVGGSMADRWGRRHVIFITLLLGAIPLYFLPLFSNWVAFVLAILIGGLLGASHSVLVVIIQDLLPTSKSLASGLALGYLFSSGAIATWSIGVLADQIGAGGLEFIIQLGSGIGIASACLALLLPATKDKIGG